ncbi:MAG: rhodanese-like domain-containing protein [Flavobacteriales bacterium]|nr:rhodanese-like domain-containing protein [Flavobacteriales bacterium]
MKTKQEIIQPFIQKAEHINPFKFQDYISENPETLIIDLRSDAEFNAGHIRGAINMNRGIVETSLAEKYPDITDDTKIILYCIAGGISAMTQLALKEYGYKNVLDISGGIKNYVDKGFSLFNILGEFKFENFGALEK